MLLLNLQRVEVEGKVAEPSPGYMAEPLMRLLLHGSYDILMVFQCISWGLVSFTSENTNPTDQRCEGEARERIYRQDFEAPRRFQTLRGR